jgi:TRAP-type mannitol/chloroaromatic compound transport system substrate-binding protein
MLAPAIQNATRPSQVITWTRGDSSPENLTDAVITAKIYDASTNVSRAVTGSLSITTAAAGVFTWAYSPADVLIAGAFEVQFTATFSLAPTVAKTISERWHVLVAR